MHAAHHDICIVGAGLSGLATATFLLNGQTGLDVLVLERDEHVGGAMATFNDQGYQAEWGPHGFLDNCAESRQLLALAELESEVVTAPLSRFVRHVCLDGRLCMIPQSPRAILTAPLIPWAAKLRVLADLWKKPLIGEPSVAQWVRYRFGEALVPFADAVFTGTYAGDIERLHIDAVMPGVRAVERQHGSMIRGLLAKKRGKKKTKEQEKPALPAMTSFKKGMAMLPHQLARMLSARGALRCSCPVRAVAREAQGWKVTSDDQTISCRQLVLALPVNQSLQLVSSALPETPPPLAAIPDARILSVLLGVDGRAQIPPGFGYLAPEREGRFALGALFSSNMFPGRAPEGYQLLEVLVGGRRHPERLELDDTELIDRVCQDVGKLMQLPEPSYVQVLRTPSGIPQLEAGYTRLLVWRDGIHQRHPDLHILGFGWQGIGINDMVKEASRMADIINAATTGSYSPEIKPIYF